MPRRELPHSDAFDLAIENGDVAAAWFHAHNLARVSTYRALRLTILLGYETDRSYAGAARRFLGRFISEFKPSLSLIELTAHALKILGDDRQGLVARRDARDGLLILARHVEKGEPEKWDGELSQF